MFLSFVGECHWCLEYHIYNLNRSSTNTGTNFIMNHSNSSSQVILIMFWESSCQFQEIYIRCLIKDLHGIHYSNFLTHSWFIFIYLNISKINVYPFKLKEWILLAWSLCIYRGLTPSLQPRKQYPIAEMPTSTI